MQIVIETAEQDKALSDIIATAHGIAFACRDHDGLPHEVRVPLDVLTTLREAFKTLRIPETV